MIKEFARRNRVKTKRDECGETIAPGKKGDSHIFDYGDGQLGVMIMPGPKETRTWNNARKAFLAAGMEITQNAEHEGAATFDPDDKEQVRLAKKYAGIVASKKATQAQLESLARFRTRNDSKGPDHVQVSPEPSRAFLEAGTPPLSGEFSASAASARGQHRRKKTA